MKFHKVKSLIADFVAVFSKPLSVAFVLLFSGVYCAVVGVYILAGLGWALIAASVFLLLPGAVLFRGAIAEHE